MITKTELTQINDMTNHVNKKLQFRETLVTLQPKLTFSNQKQMMEQSMLERILDISRRMAETRTLEPLLNLVIDEAVKLVGAEQGYIVMVQPDGRLEITVKRGRLGEKPNGNEDQISASVFNDVVKSGKPLVLRDALNDPRFGEAMSVINMKLRSIMCVPFISRGEVIGAIYVESRSVRSRFSEDDLPPLILFANQAGVAIENAALNDDLELRVSARTRELEKSWQELVEVNRLRTVWLGNVAHDLRAPLGITSASLSLLQEGAMGDLTEAQFEWISKSLETVLHTSNLINDLFDVFKLESGGMRLYREMVELQDFLQGVYSVGLGFPWPKRVTLDLELQAPLPSAFVDPLRVRQVLLNLLSNAQKFTTQGSVILYARHIPENGELLIGVKDSGEGIALDKQNRLFQRFQQVDGDAERKRKGSGLGLAICRELIEMHGGRIWVESTPGEGADFKFVLPLKPPVQAAKAQ